jgi:hypothetical protein
MNDSLIYGIATLFTGLVALLVRYGFKSKCSNVSLCFGLIKIERDIEQEIVEQKMEENSPKRELSLQNIGQNI